VLCRTWVLGNSSDEFLLKFHKKGEKFKFASNIQSMSYPQETSSNGAIVRVFDSTTAEFDWKEHASRCSYPSHGSYYCQLSVTSNSQSVLTTTVRNDAGYRQLSFAALTPGTQCNASFYCHCCSTFATIAFNMPSTQPSNVAKSISKSNLQVYDIQRKSAKFSWAFYIAAKGWSGNRYTCTAMLKDNSTQSVTPIVSQRTCAAGVDFRFSKLVPGRSYSVQFSCSGGTQETVDFTTLAEPEDEKYNVLIPEPKGFGTLKFGTTKFTEIQKHTKDQNQNILLLGPFGSGKSSFLNTLLTATGSKREARVSGDRDHGTVTLEKYEIPQTNLTVWDCWGFSKKNFDSVLLNEILDGHFQSGKEMKSGISRNAADFKKNPRTSDLMHNVIFVIAAPDLSGNGDLRDKVKEFLDLLFRKGYNPVLALTKIDLVDKSLAASPQKVYSSALANKEIYKAANLSGLNPCKVFPVKNYNFEFDRNPLLENAHMHCLSAAVKQGQTFDADGDAVMIDVCGDQVDFKSILKKHGLESLAGSLEEIGVTQPEDLGLIEDKDLSSTQFKPIQLRKLKNMRDKFASKY
jgi:putative ribosome biogenesis GTPase RsgA